METIAKAQLSWWFAVSTVGSLVILAVLTWVGQPLEAPPQYRRWGLSDGIVAFELARATTAAQGLINHWEMHGVSGRVRLSLECDFLFILAYVVATASGCLVVASAIGQTPVLPTVGRALAWGVILAGLLDGIENVALLKQLQSGATRLLAETAYWCATVKFVLVFAGLGYLLLSFIWLAIRRYLVSS